MKELSVMLDFNLHNKKTNYVLKLTTLYEKNWTIDIGTISFTRET